MLYCNSEWNCPRSGLGGKVPWAPLTVAAVRRCRYDVCSKRELSPVKNYLEAGIVDSELHFKGGSTFIVRDPRGSQLMSVAVTFVPL